MKKRLQNVLHRIDGPSLCIIALIVALGSALIVFHQASAQNAIVWQGRLSSTNLLNYQSVNGTNNGSLFAVGTVTLPQTAFQIQNGGLSSTNALTNYIQLTLDGSNFTTIQVYKSGSTNARVDTITVSNNTFTVYARMQVTTTNSTPVGVTALTSQ